MKASVVIPTYNNTEELEMTLESMLGQICHHPFEVIVTDDGSSVDNISVVERFANRLRVKYCTQEDLGFRAGTARNNGAKIAEGEVLIFIDSGVIAGSGLVQAHIDVHDSNEDPCFVYGYVYSYGVEDSFEPDELRAIIDNNPPDTAIQILHDMGHGDRREKVYGACGDDLSVYRAPYTMCFSLNISIKRMTFFNVAMFDEYFVRYGEEDIELGMHLYKKGVRFVLSRDAKSAHYPHKKRPYNPTGDKWDEKRYRCFMEHINHICKKHGPEILLMTTPGEFIKDGEDRTIWIEKMLTNAANTIVRK